MLGTEGRPWVRGLPQIPNPQPLGPACTVEGLIWVGKAGLGGKLMMLTRGGTEGTLGVPVGDPGRAQSSVLCALILCGALGYPKIEVVALHKPNLCSPALWDARMSPR